MDEHISRTQLAARRWLRLVPPALGTFGAALMLAWWQRAHIEGVTALPRWFAYAGGILIAAVVLRGGVRASVATIGLWHPLVHPPSWFAVAIGLASAVWVALGLDELASAFSFQADTAQWLATAALIVSCAPASVLLVGMLLQLARLLVRRRAGVSLKIPGPTRPTVEQLRRWVSDDAPVQQFKDDLFGHALLAQRVATRIQAELPASQALLGDFGSGKTSIRNLVEAMVRRNRVPPTEFVHVELWAYETPRAAVEGILRALLTALGRQVNILHLRGLPAGYAEAIASAGGFGALLSGLANRKPPTEALQEIDESASAIGVRYVLWVEDLERFSVEHGGRAEVSSDELERLAPIRALLFGLDRLRAVCVITATTTLFQRFDLEKIARYVERIPRTDDVQVRRLIATLRHDCLADDSVIDPLGRREREQMGWQEKDDLVIAFIGSRLRSIADAIVALCGTPRILKQTLRRVLETWGLIPGELDIDELLAMSAVRESAPDAFALIESWVDELRAVPLPSRRGAAPLDEIQKQLAGLGLPRQRYEAVWLIVFQLFKDPRRPQPMGKRTHADYWQRFLSIPSLQEHECDQPVLRVLTDANIERIIDLLSDPLRSGAVEDFSQLLDDQTLLSLLVPLVERRANENPHDWGGEHRPPGMVELWRMFRKRTGVIDDDEIAREVKNAIAVAAPVNLALLAEVEHWFATTSRDISDLISSPARMAELKGLVRESLKKHYTDSPEKLVRSLRGAPPPTLLWLCWGLERIRAEDLHGQPFEGWRDFADTLRKAVALDAENMAIQIAALLTRETRSRDVLCFVVAAEQCDALFGGVESIAQTLVDAGIDRRREDRVGALLAKQAEPAPIMPPNADRDSMEALRKLAKEAGETPPEAVNPGQVEGYVFLFTDEIPPEKPDYPPTAAFLPELEGTFADARCLDLVDVEGLWLPLSKAGVHTYAHSTSIINGDGCYFVRADEWGVVYGVGTPEFLSRSDVRKVFGEEAAHRAREDQPSLVVRIHKA